MQTQIVKMINDFEHGRLSWRQLIAYLTGMFAASLGATIGLADQQDGRAAPQSADSASTFDAIDLNHIALNVTDVQRSQKWYEKHLGLKPTASRITIQPMRSRDSKPPASRPDAKTGVCILPIRTASNVRSRMRDRR